MATRARIGLELKDGSYISSYQHWDGYPGGLGYTLIDHWENYDKIEEAIELGNASSWRYMVGQKIDFDDRSNPLHEVQNCYYGRDRGETGTEARTFKTIAEWVESMAGSWCEYFYLFDGQDWIVSNGKKNSSGCFEFDFLEVAILKEIVEN